jgi:hypothetical protein
MPSAALMGTLGQAMVNSMRERERREGKNGEFAVDKNQLALIKCTSSTIYFSSKWFLSPKTFCSARNCPGNFPGKPGQHYRMMLGF